MVKASDFLIALDDGHGPHTAGKRTPFINSLNRKIHENEFNKAVVNLLAVELKRCKFQTLQLAPTDIDTPLQIRTNTANEAKANLLISIHFNSIGNTFGYSNAKGFSVHIQPSDKSNPNSGSLKFAKLLIEELKKGTPQINRGIVGQDLHMTRESEMPAALIECGFMDDKTEALLMINPAFQSEVAQEISRSVCRYFGVPFVAAEPKTGNARGIGKVVINTDELALRELPNLNAPLIRRLEKGYTYFAYGKEGMWYNLGGGQWASEGAAKNHLTFTSHPKTDSIPTPSKGTLYKVQVGVFTEKENAERLAEELQAKGYPVHIVEL